MNVTVYAKPITINRRSEYPRKPNGDTDYRAKQVEYFETELEILEGAEFIRGSVTVRETLDFSKLYRISVDTTRPMEIAESNEVTGAKSAEQV